MQVVKVKQTRAQVTQRTLKEYKKNIKAASSNDQALASLLRPEAARFAAMHLQDPNVALLISAAVYRYHSHQSGSSYLLMANIHGRERTDRHRLFGLGTHTLTVYSAHAHNNILVYVGT